MWSLYLQVSARINGPPLHIKHTNSLHSMYFIGKNELITITWITNRQWSGDIATWGDSHLKLTD